MENSVFAQPQAVEANVHNLFEVEELEQRLETGEWSLSAGAETDVHTGATAPKVGVGLKF